MFNFRDKKINIVKNLWIFLLISVVIILAGLVDTFWVRGLNLGVEFSGGASIDVSAVTNRRATKNIMKHLKIISVLILKTEHFARPAVTDLRRILSVYLTARVPYVERLQ